MNRRGFLQRLVGALAALPVAAKIAKASRAEAVAQVGKTNVTDFGYADYRYSGSPDLWMWPFTTKIEAQCAWANIQASFANGALTIEEYRASQLRIEAKFPGLTGYDPLKVAMRDADRIRDGNASVNQIRGERGMTVVDDPLANVIKQPGARGRWIAMDGTRTDEPTSSEYDQIKWPVRPRRWALGRFVTETHPGK